MMRGGGAAGSADSQASHQRPSVRETHVAPAGHIG